VRLFPCCSLFGPTSGRDFLGKASSIRAAHLSNLCYAQRPKDKVFSPDGTGGLAPVWWAPIGNSMKQCTAFQREREFQRFGMVAGSSKTAVSLLHSAWLGMARPRSHLPSHFLGMLDFPAICFWVNPTRFRRSMSNWPTVWIAAETGLRGLNASVSVDKGTSIVRCVNVKRAKPCAAANPAGASRLQSMRPVRRVAELGSLGGEEHEHQRATFAESRTEMD
jgi:hypothetical protein